jgi:hypothetical protein
MRMDGAAEPLPEPAESAVRCGGFFIVWLDERPSVRLIPGDRLLAPDVPRAVSAALEEAAQLLFQTVGASAQRRPWDRVEISIRPGARVEGEALPLGSGCIRLAIGEETSASAAAAIARHEALHLLLASALRGGEKWCDPELAFPDWIVRGIEGRLSPSIPRFREPWPKLLDPLPPSRQEVQRRLRSVADDVSAARAWFGEALCAALQGLPEEGSALPLEQQQLWLVEASLGTHYLEAAARLWTGDAEALRPVLLDDWLIDYEQYARGLANPPRGAGHLWRIQEPEWSREPLVRLSVTAQALQRDDHCAFAAGAAPGEALVWRNRGCVRLPLIRSPDGVRPPPVQGFRSALRGVEGDVAARCLALIEEAAREAASFEARALWPRILSRLLHADLPWPEVGPAAVPAVQILDAPEAFVEWAAAADALRALLGGRAGWIPRVLQSRPASTLVRAPPPPASILIVHGAPPSPASLLAARDLAARIPVRGALFFGDLGGGAAYEQIEDLEEPLDPRYREEPWVSGDLPASLADLPRFVDEATRTGRPTSPLSWLLSISAIGLEECHYPRGPAGAPRAARR